MIRDGTLLTAVGETAQPPLYDFGVITGMAQAPDPLCRKDFGGNVAGSITRRS
jgi:hypothetical protein